MKRIDNHIKGCLLIASPTALEVTALMYFLLRIPRNWVLLLKAIIIINYSLLLQTTRPLVYYTFELNISTAGRIEFMLTARF